MLGRLFHNRRHKVPALSWVTPELAVGPAVEPEDYSRLSQEGIGAVLDLRAEVADRPEEPTAELPRRRIPIQDHHVPTQAQLAEAVGWIQQQLGSGRRVYVHCQQGVGRSPMIVAAVLIDLGYSPNQAITLLRQHHESASPNSKQLEALLRFHQQRQARSDA